MNIYTDLLTFTVKHLKVGGRLVTWFPVFREDYDVKRLPSHPNLKLIGNSEQILSKYTSRRLLTYERLNNVNINEDDDDCSEENNTIQDFRAKYFEIREEARKERRMKKAAVRERDRLDAESKRKIKEKSFDEMTID